MADTPNLGGTHLTEAQTQKATAANVLFDLHDEAIAGLLVHNFASDADYTLITASPEREHENYVLKFTDTGAVLTTTRNIVLPATRQPHAVWNLTAQSLIVKVTGSSDTVTVATGTRSLLYCDSVDVWEFSNNAVGTFLGLSDTFSSFSGLGGFGLQVNSGETAIEAVANPLDTGLGFSGVPTASQSTVPLKAVRNYSFPVDMVGSTGTASVAATASTVFSIEKNGTPFGTATFAAAATICTFVAASGASFVAAMDILTVVAPATPDATLANIGFMFKGTRD